MACISKTLNTNNFVRWVAPEAGTTLAQLQALGSLPTNNCGDAVEICGLSLSVAMTVDSVTVKPVFSSGGYVVEMRIEDESGNAISGYDWQVTNSIVAGLDAGNYVAKVRKVLNFTCAAEKAFTVQNTCDIGVETFVNGTNVLIAHYYDTIEHPTEYRIERKRGLFDPVGIPLVVDGYDWTELPELQVNTLPDGDYFALVRKKSSPSCQAVKAFSLKVTNLEVTNFYEQHWQEIQGLTYTNYFDIENKSSYETRQLHVNASVISPLEIHNDKTGTVFGEDSRIISIVPGETVRVRFKFPSNNTGMTQYPIITLRDITIAGALIRVKTVDKVEDKTSVFIKYSLSV